MRLSETITIYLAVGAPFGVNYFLRERSEKEERRRALSLLRAASAALLWPLFAVASYMSRRALVKLPAEADERRGAVDEQTSERIEAAQQQLLVALERVRELAAPCVGRSEDLEQSVRSAREAIEKYAGLTLALASMKLTDAPALREMELCRIAGREGEDLLLAGRCIHRRNVSRLVASHARSRTELLHALAAVREINGDKLNAASSSLTNAARQLSLAVLKLYGQAINLLSLLEDESATRAVARLLDAECARLRKLEALVNESFISAVDGKQARHAYTDWPTLAER
ncbi:MAG: hypothetical protein QOF02_981 [Blastocatellia bacterium]|jgi:hypothetical protein|nr:hypothetical protein [Blastocatellia bacterium]